MGPFGKSPTLRGDDILFWKVQLCLLFWNVEIFLVEQKSSADVNCWHIQCVLFPVTPPAVLIQRFEKWPKIGQECGLCFPKLGKYRLCFIWGSLIVPRAVSSGFSLHVGIFIQLLLLESCWRELLSFHLGKLSRLGWTMSWLAWPGVGSRWGHLQGSLSRNSSVSCDYGPSLLRILNYPVKYPNFYNYSPLLKLGCWKSIMLKVGLFRSVL